MSKVWGRLSSYFRRNRSFQGVDKAGNQYFTRTEFVDGIMKEKRWVIFKNEDDPTSIPVEWICWLNGQRKRAPSPEEMAERESRRERVKLDVALLKKEEEERKAKEGSRGKNLNTDKVGGPDLKSFIQQFPDASEVEGDKFEEASNAVGGKRSSEQTETAKQVFEQEKGEQESSEPTGSGQSFRPGTWQPPT